MTREEWNAVRTSAAEMSAAWAEIASLETMPPQAEHTLERALCEVTRTTALVLKTVYAQNRKLSVAK